MNSGLALDIARDLLDYSISMEKEPDARLKDAIFMRIQAERIVNQIEKESFGKG